MKSEEHDKTVQAVVYDGNLLTIGKHLAFSWAARARIHWRQESFQ